jgi:eight-cysteine-cluster-containing protein
MLKEVLFIFGLTILVVFTLLLSTLQNLSTPQTTISQEITIITTTPGEIITIPHDEYYGYSTFGYCKNNFDCFVSGCNREICQSKFEEARFSVCIIPNKPTPQQIGYSCVCLNNRCQWWK